MDLDLGLVQPYGQGSLFDTTVVNGYELKTTDRWRDLLCGEKFASILDVCRSDEEFTTLIADTFPDDEKFFRI